MGEGSRTIRDGSQRLVCSVLDCAKPVIAAVNGTAAGGGMHLVASFVERRPAFRSVGTRKPFKRG